MRMSSNDLLGKIWIINIGFMFKFFRIFKRKFFRNLFFIKLKIIL